ncbi:SERTA domain-containing protein 2 taranis isoform X2 [Musca autumnalis]|uniref:SERTA domain-containing protein 2 taranis isoform X2 n=1 Tax=Musca autumnalis TaxID=221902 RepID=UPI003CE9D1D4
MCTEVNSAMGLQATAATKRKHDLSFDSKDTNTYTNCPPPIKASKWSINNNNYADSAQEQKATQLTNGCSKLINNNNNENKSCQISCSNASSISLRNGKEVPKSPAATNVTMFSSLIAANLPAVATDADETTPLPPTSTTPVPEDSIAKLEVVANVACEPWTSTPEPVDCISKLQAVAVPSDPWGSISTRSTLATTLLSADELDDDDDDFEDDYEEEESIIPTYCPLRYHTFPSSNSSSSPSLQGSRINGNFPPSSSQSYGSRPNYYSEPFPQQNCSRTASQPHMRNNNTNGFVWTNGSANNSSFYSASESAYSAQQPQQQTIRCAENGKSYLELGCSSPAPNSNINPVLQPTSPFMGSALEARHSPIKRCCDGRGTWCSNNKNCYKDIRLKIRNLSMFKLSRFRQVSEQSLYRSVLICNTLKRIDREIEAEAKEMHQASAHAAQQQQQHHLQHSLHQQPQYHHHLHSHMQIQSPVHNSSNGGQQQQSLQHHHTQQPMLHPQHQDYMPVLNCGRLGGNVEYHNQQQQQQSNSQTFHQQQSHYHTERVLDISQPSFQNSVQKPATVAPQFTHSNNSCAVSMSNSTTTTLHPYDHYPFREANSGRVTPFPCQSVISTPPPTPASVSTSSQTQQVQSVSTASANSSAIPSSASSLMSDTDSGYADDESTRSINWSSVLSLSSQSALDPLNNNDIFSILPPANPATAVPVSVTSTGVTGDTSTSSSSSVAISGTFTAVQSSGASLSCSNSCSNSSTTPPSATTTATFTTLSTISSATHSLTSSYATSMNSSSTWEYGFLDMEFGLGTEFTELAPSCKYSSADDLFKNSLTPVNSARYDNELEQPAHIMVGS